MKLPARESGLSRESGLAKRSIPALYPALATKPGCAPFVYRLGREIFNLERGVRLP